MKKLLIALAALCCAIPVHAEAQVGGGIGSEKLTPAGEDMPAVPPVDSVVDDWSTRFPDTGSLRDFKLLREYRAEKEGMLAEYESREEELKKVLGRAREIYQARQALVAELGRLLAAKRGDSTAVSIVYSLHDEHDAILGTVTPGSPPRAAVAGLRDLLNGEMPAAKTSLAEAEAAYQQVLAAVARLEHLVRDCESAIDAALAPEYENMRFKRDVSLFFSALIAVMIISFFAVIYMKSGAGVGQLMLSDGGLQFVTIFVLIIAIILFGILSILEGRELAAILSGIAGYILGRGAQAKADAGPARDTPAPAPPEAKPAAPATVPPAEPGPKSEVAVGDIPMYPPRS